MGVALVVNGDAVDGSNMCTESISEAMFYDVLLWQAKHIQGSKERYLLGEKYSMRFFRVIPFIKLQNDTSKTGKR